MKKIMLIFGILSLVFTTISQEEIKSEQNKKVPSIKLKTIDGKEVNTAELELTGPIILSFWASWCPICNRELGAINDVYSDWQKETGVTLVAISVDDEKTKNNVPNIVNGKGWEYLVLLDPNGDFKRMMGVSHTPHTFLINTDGEIVYSHNNYAPGDEDILYEELLKLIKK